MVASSIKQVVSVEPKVLLVDDDPAVLVFMKKLLEKHGYVVLEANNGKEGLKKARDEGPDIILLDIMMPKLDGWEVARKLKDDPKTKNIPIIMLTVLAEDEHKQKSFEYADADFHISKNFDINALFTILDLANYDIREMEKRIEYAVDRDKKLREVYSMINPKLLNHNYDFLDK